MLNAKQIQAGISLCSRFFSAVNAYRSAFQIWLFPRPAGALNTITKTGNDQYRNPSPQSNVIQAREEAEDVFEEAQCRRFSAKRISILTLSKYRNQLWSIEKCKKEKHPGCFLQRLLLSWSKAQHGSHTAVLAGIQRAVFNGIKPYKGEGRWGLQVFTWSCFCSVMGL